MVEARVGVESVIVRIDINHFHTMKWIKNLDFLWFPFLSNVFYDVGLWPSEFISNTVRLPERSPMMERYFLASKYWKISKFIFSEDSRLWYGNIVTLLLIRVFDNESLINVWWLVLTDFHSKFYITRYNLEWWNIIFFLFINMID